MLWEENSVSEKYALHADIYNLGSGYMTDYMSLLQSPGTEGQNMRLNRFSYIGPII